jgi:hypothetical protein
MHGACPRELVKAALSLFNGLNPLLCFGEAALQRVLERLKVAVHLDDAWKQLGQSIGSSNRVAVCTSSIVWDLPGCVAQGRVC